jgi:hypothetical protein
MNAEILTWDEARPVKGTRILIQGALMKFIKDLPDKSDEDVRYIEVEYKGMDIEMAMFRNYLTAIIKDE